MTAVTVVRWVEGLRFEALLPDGTRLAFDSGAEGSAAAKPVGVLLVALAACSAMDVISICRKKRVEVGAYEIHVQGRQREAHPRTYASIQVEHHVAGEHIDDAAVSRSIFLSASRYCPVNAHLSAGDTEIHHVSVISDRAGRRTSEVLVTGPFGAGLEPTPPRAA